MELKAIDLRIGNYVYDRHAKEIEKVTPMWITYQDYWIKHDDKKCLKPIPITEDILLRLGFFEKESMISTINWNDPNSDCKVYFHSIDDIYVIYGENEYSFRNELYLKENIKLSSIHQLQNIFHALTGEELKLKEQ